ncbi:ABC transporter permease [Capnocytophaga sp. ARDL2]|uniref:ABC transporter permease n=1 Tax=Capnocytophaga sp. ARDL2 TaxID=3238809 RepID=UPI0035581793
MKVELFVTRKLISSRNYKNSVSAPIVKIAIAAVSLAMIMILIAFSTGTGLQLKLRDKVTSFAGHITISNYDNNHSEVTTTSIEKKQASYPIFQQISGIISVHPIATKAGVIRTNESFEGIIFKGVDKDFYWKKIKDYLTQGRLPQFENEGMTNEIILSDYIANRLNIKIGDKVQTYFLRNDSHEQPIVRGFTVVGLYTSGIEQLDKNFMYGDLKHIQRLNRWSENEIGAFEVLIDDFKKIDFISEKIYENIPSELNAVPITDKFYNIFEWLKIFDINIYIILSLMIGVGAINMIVVLLVLVIERTQMIGTLQALGMRISSIRKIFLFQTTYILLNGLFWGNLIGLGLLFIQYQWGIITLDPAQYYVKEAPVHFDIFQIAMVNLLFVILCYLILIVPSYIIHSLNPIEAMKRK